MLTVLTGEPSWVHFEGWHLYITWKICHFPDWKIGSKSCVSKELELLYDGLWWIDRHLFVSCEKLERIFRTTHVQHLAHTHELWQIFLLCKLPGRPWWVVRVTRAIHTVAWARPTFSSHALGTGHYIYKVRDLNQTWIRSLTSPSCRTPCPSSLVPDRSCVVQTADDVQWSVSHAQPCSKAEPSWAQLASVTGWPSLCTPGWEFSVV